jgi:DNA polymerase-1
LDADFSAQEVRILAELSQDKRLIHLFKTMQPHENIYVQIAKQVFGQEIKKGTKEYDDTKALVLGTNYGMSIWGLIERTGWSESEADRIQRKFFSVFPGVRKYMFDQKRATDIVTTPLGRKYWLNPHSKQGYRNALNSPIQGGAADQLKLAIGIIHRRWKHEPFMLVTQVYDELVAIVPDELVEAGKQMMQEAMVESGKLVHPSVPAVADVGVGQNWLEAKG